MRLMSMGRHRWTKESSRRAHEAKRRKREAGPEPEREPERLPEGELIGTLTWRWASGEEKVLTIRQGKRRNQIQVEGMEHSIGWDKLLRHVRHRLAVPKRRFPLPEDSTAPPVA